MPLDQSEAGEEADRDNGEHPDDRDDDRETVEVSLGNTARTESRRDPATEHVRQSPAASAVQKNRHREQDAGNREDDLNDDVKNVHGVNSLCDDVLRELHNFREFLRVEARASDERAVDILFPHE